MNRLTERYKSVVLCRCKCPDEEAREAGAPACSICDHFIAMLNRLAAYEDTGLEPKDVQKLMKNAEKIDFLLNGNVNGPKKLGKKEERI